MTSLREGPVLLGDGLPGPSLSEVMESPLGTSTQAGRDDPTGTAALPSSLLALHRARVAWERTSCQLTLDQEGERVRA